MNDFSATTRQDQSAGVTPDSTAAPDLSAASVSAEANRFRDQITPTFSYSSQLESTEQWSSAQPTMNQYRITAQDVYEGLEGRQAAEVIGRIEFLRENMNQGATTSERQQAQEKLASAFNIITTGKSESEIYYEIERAYENMRHEVLDAGQARIQQRLEPDRLEAQLSAIEARIERDQQQLDLLGSRVSNRVIRTLTTRIQKNERELTALQNQADSGELSFSDRMEITRAQDRVMNTLEERGRQGLPGGIDVEALFAGSRAAQREIDNGGGARRFAREEYIQKVAETRVEREQERLRRAGPVTINADDGPTATRREPHPVHYGSAAIRPGSTDPDTGFRSRYPGQTQSRTQNIDQEIAEIRQRGQQYRAAVEVTASADYQKAMETVAGGGNISFDTALMDDVRLRAFGSAVADALRNPANRGDPTLAKLEQQLLPIYKERTQRESDFSPTTDANTLYATADNSARAALVSGMTDERLQAVRERIEQALTDPKHENNENLRRLEAQIEMTIERREEGSTKKQLTPNPNLQSAVEQEFTPRLVASQLWNALNRGDRIETQLSNLTAEQRNELLTQVARAKELPAYQNDRHLQTMERLLA